jgi:sec-independent protein translocase protein TatC
MKLKTNASQKTTPKPSTEKFLTFADHIKELRGRLFWVVIIFLLVSALAYNYRDILVDVIMAPLNHQKLIYLTPGGGFAFIFQVTFYAALVVVAPVLVYHLYNFLKPALPAHAKRSTPKVVLFASLLMSGGVAFGYFVAVPSALKFLSTFAGSDILPNLTADSYLNFFLSYVAGLGLLFQLPLLLLLWHWINPFTPSGLLKSERVVILFAFVASAIITPTPDIFNQAMIAVPLILIYQIGVVAVLVSIKHHKLNQVPISPKSVLSQNLQPKAPVIRRTSPAQSATSLQKPQVRPVIVNDFGPRRRHAPQSLVANPRQEQVRKVPYITRAVPSERPVARSNRRPVISIDGITPLKS